jgi:hypothetical protein
LWRVTHLASGQQTRYLASQGVDAKVDFIFDQQTGISADLPLFFDHMMRSLPRQARKMVSEVPIFRDDKVMIPLQAADMLAWHFAGTTNGVT